MKKILFLISLFLVAAVQAEGYTRRFPSVADVCVTGGFWLPRIETNRTVTLRTCFEKCSETRIPNFQKAGERQWGTFKGVPFDDSDVFKVLEAAAYITASRLEPGISAKAAEIFRLIASAQEPDGYLYTARTLGFRYDETGKTNPAAKMMGPVRWSNCASSHELYNVGHLYEAAVAWYGATGEKTLLEVALKSADLVARTFGPEPTQLKDVPGHEEIELALCRLYRVTGEKKYLALAKHFVDRRGYGVKTRDGMVFTQEGLLVAASDDPDSYNQNHMPVKDQREAVGHAVRAVYLYCAMTDLAALTGDDSYLKAVDALWENVTGRKLHLNGSVGARRKGESFGADYELPHLRAYLETCAGIGNALWNARMFLLKGDAKYIDVMERGLYNGILSGVSLSGDEFFYENPLSANAEYKRSKWFGCSCCPVNIVRFIPQVATFAYAASGHDAYVNLFMESEASLELDCGKVKLRQKTDYPWGGGVGIAVTPPRDGTRFALYVRVPGWCVGRPVPSDLYEQVQPGSADDFSVSLNGERIEFKPVKGYCVIDREWKAGDKVDISMNMPIRRIKAHKKAVANAGRLAVERGPVVFCAEGVDNERTARCNSYYAVVPEKATFTESRISIGSETFPALDASNGTKLVPYCIWGNRLPGNKFQTWFLLKDRPPPRRKAK